MTAAVATRARRCADPGGTGCGLPWRRNVLRYPHGRDVLVVIIEHGDLLGIDTDGMSEPQLPR
jgi:hypothetical protein